MKKILLTVVMMVFLAACSEVAENNDPETELNDIYNAYESYDSIENISEHTNQYFLDDLDFMMGILEGTMPMPIAYWARGLDIRAMANNARADIINTHEKLDEASFQKILHRNFIQLYGFGGFRILATRQNADLMNITLLDSIIDDSLDLFLTLQEQYGQDPQMLEYIFAQAIGMDAGWDAASQISPIAQIDDFETFYMLITSMVDVDYIGNNVVTDIIDDGHIAYLRINSFQVSSQQQNHDEAIILEFYDEIRGFEHLIIDLRINNSTVNLDYVFRTLIGHLISESKTLYLYSFVSQEYVESRLTLPPPSLGAGIMADIEYIPIAELLEAGNLHSINMDDMNQMSYGFRTRFTVSPRNRENPAFDGNIWILTGSSSGTFSMVSAWFMKETEIATVIGGITNGNFGALPQAAVMPHSNLAFVYGSIYTTDHHGRPMEAGTLPHYFNIPGMDALATALAIIADPDLSQ